MTNVHITGHHITKEIKYQHKKRLKSTRKIWLFTFSAWIWT